MNKAEFQQALRHALGKLPSYEVEQTITFYSEAIDDRVEDGMSEEEAVAALGSVNAIAAQIIAETPPIPKAIAKANTGSRTLNVVLLAVFSPIWVPIALALAVAALAVYLSIWTVIIALWATVLMFLLCGPLGIVGLIWCSIGGYPISGIAMFGSGLIGVGIGLFAWFGVLAASRGLVKLTHSFALWIKSLFVKKSKQNGGPAGYPGDMPNLGPNGAPNANPNSGQPPQPPTAPYAAQYAGDPFAPQTTGPVGTQPMEGAPRHV